MLSAGEASGDLHGGTLCRALRALEPTVNLVGMGGPMMAPARIDVVSHPTPDALLCSTPDGPASAPRREAGQGGRRARPPPCSRPRASWRLVIPIAASCSGPPPP